MNAVLVCEDLKFILTEECPPEPAKNISQAIRDARQYWVSVNKKAHCHLLVGMSEILAIKHEPMATAYEMLESLQDMFG